LLTTARRRPQSESGKPDILGMFQTIDPPTQNVGAFGKLVKLDAPPRPGRSERQRTDRVRLDA